MCVTKLEGSISHLCFIHSYICIIFLTSIFNILQQHRICGTCISAYMIHLLWYILNAYLLNTSNYKNVIESSIAYVWMSLAFYDLLCTCLILILVVLFTVNLFDTINLFSMLKFISTNISIKYKFYLSFINKKKVT